MNFEYYTERLLLKPLNEHHAALVLSFYKNNQEIFEQREPKRPESFYTLAYQKKVLTYEQKEMAEGRFIRFYIFLRNQPNKIIGSVCFQNILKSPYQSCSIGYKIDKDHLRQHYGEEAVSAAISAMFHEHNIHRVEAYIEHDNLASIRFIEKMKFSFEGTVCSYANINGTWRDFKQYAFINPL